ncbi:hypothetical protein BKA70DRAFT_1431903 [Coprinopsis sp. MPI-PUGE-AT-0042]|nr:hypothetical protein BKA70DRAFT_1431903 [Coprinopsis sp. MPI-PUGE-AT-0042]
MSSCLPPELLREIANHIAGDTDSLRTMALASTSFCSASQPVLFSHIFLLFNPSSNGTNLRASVALRLAEAYRQSPVLLTYAKSIKVQDLPGLNPPSGSPFPPEYLAALWMLAKQPLDTVEIIWGRRWNLQIQEAFEALIQCPTLASLRLSTLPIQLAYGIQSSCLKELSMHRMFDATSEGAISWFGCQTANQISLPSTTPPGYSLRSLCLEGGNHETTFCQTLDLTRLRNLRLDDPNYHSPSEALQQCLLPGI